MAFGSQLEYDKRHESNKSENNTISFISKENEDEGFYELLLNKVPVRSAGQHKYTVNSKGLEILQSKHIKFKVIC